MNFGFGHVGICYFSSLSIYCFDFVVFILTLILYRSFLSLLSPSASLLSLLPHTIRTSIMLDIYSPPLLCQTLSPFFVLLTQLLIFIPPFMPPPPPLSPRSMVVAIVRIITSSTTTITVPRCSSRVCAYAGEAGKESFAGVVLPL